MVTAGLRLHWNPLPLERVVSGRLFAVPSGWLVRNSSSRWLRANAPVFPLYSPPCLGPLRASSHPGRGGFPELPHASAARLWFGLPSFSQCIELAASLLLQIKHLPVPSDNPPHSELSWKRNLSSTVSYYKTKRPPSDGVHMCRYQSKVTQAPQALNYSSAHWPDYLFRQAVRL